MNVETDRVAPGDYSPAAPTDPDVRDQRIRLVKSWVRCRRVLSVGVALTRKGFQSIRGETGDIQILRA